MLDVRQKSHSMSLSSHLRTVTYAFSFLLLQNDVRAPLFQLCVSQQMASYVDIGKAATEIISSMQGFAWVTCFYWLCLSYLIFRHWQSKATEDSWKEQWFPGSVCNTCRGVVSNWRALWIVRSLCLCSLWCQERYIWCKWASVWSFLCQERWGWIARASYRGAGTA